MAKKEFKKDKSTKKQGKGKFKDRNLKEDLDSKDSKKGTTACSYDNDSSWYAPDDTLLSQVNTFSFDDTIGVKIRDYLHRDDAAPDRVYTFVGAIMSIWTFPSIGQTDKPGYINNFKSAVSAASQRAYSILSSSNGKTTKYLPEDIALVILMLGNIIEMVSCYWRLYGTQFMFNPRNRLVPNALIDAQGFKHDNFLTNIANSRARFNALMARLDGVSMFADIDYFKKCWEMNAHLFYDKNSAMGQAYVMRPSGWFRYRDGEYDETTGYFIGNTLTYEEWEGLIEIDDFLDVLENQINDMLGSELFNLVYADVIREITKNGGQYYVFGTIPENYTSFFEFSEVFMTQVHNMTWGYFPSLAGYTITDDVPSLDLKDNLLPITLNPSNHKDIVKLGPATLDLPYTDNPDYKLIADALAYKTVADYIVTAAGDDLGKCRLCAVPDHPIYKVVMYYTVEGQVSTTDVPYAASITDYGNAYVTGLSSFDIKPLAKISVGDTETRTIGELNYFTSIDAKKMQNVFEFSFLKLFDPNLRPKVGK